MKIDKVIVSDLKKISLCDGDVLHGLKKSDTTFNQFGEVYFSVINFNKIKAWKRHNKYTLNLIVPYGNVNFVFINEEGEFIKYSIGENNYKRLTIPPKTWFGFKGINSPKSIITSIIDFVHDPNEVEKKDINKFDYSW